ncbi:MAG: acyltransferase [Planctomycetes bacterium]|nr:acyltransferase [Planctomycetota bacterium]
MSQTTSKSSRYHSMDIWRGLACLMIVILHSGHFAYQAAEDGPGAAPLILAILSRLSVGVPIFFVISGYCISATTESNASKRGWRSFFYRRFRRIYPPYWIVACLALLLTTGLSIIGQSDLFSSEYGYFPPPESLSLSQWIGNITLTETWRPHVFGGPELKILGIAWTLCYEEQFYFVCGLLLLLKPERFFSGAVFVSVGTLICTVLFQEQISGFFFDGRWLLFAIGILVYYFLNHNKSRATAIVIFLAMIVLTGLVRYWPPLAALGESSIARERKFELFVAALFGGILVALHPWDIAIAKSKVLQPLSICGQMCYSLYLIHWPISVLVSGWMYKSVTQTFWGTVLVSTPLSIALSLAAGWLFHIAIERRFLNSPVGPAAVTNKNQAKIELPTA